MNQDKGRPEQGNSFGYSARKDLSKGAWPEGQTPAGSVFVAMQATMAAYGAEVILAPSMEGARDMLLEMERQGLGHCLDQVGGRGRALLGDNACGAMGGDA